MCKNIYCCTSSMALFHRSWKNLFKTIYIGHQFKGEGNEFKKILKIII